MERTWSAKQMELAKKFGQALKKAASCTWAAAEFAAKLRDTFPTRVNKGEKGWAAFCREVLGKDENTVGAYVRGWKYAARHAADRLKDRGTMPPVSLVSELAAVRENARQELHDKLFSGEYSASEFRSLLVSKRDPERDQDDEAEQDGPTDGPTRKKHPGASGTRQEKEKRNVRKIISEELPTLFEPKTEITVMQVHEWDDVNELSDAVSVLLIEGEKRLDGWTIVRIPPKTEGGNC
jgi:hypothetical protein